MKVAVLAFAGARERLGWSSRGVTLAEGATVADLLEDPALAPVAALTPSLRFAINEEFAPLGARVRDGDTVALLPPVSGG